MQRSWEEVLPDELAEFADHMEAMMVSCSQLAADSNNERLKKETDELIEGFIAKGIEVGESRGSVLFSISQALESTPREDEWKAAIHAIKTGPLRVQIYHGRVEDAALEAHTLVNPTNPAVAIGSGVSGVIAKLGSPGEFEKDTQKKFREKFPEGGELEEGDFLRSWAPMHSNFKHVVHVATVNYREGLATKASRIFSAMVAAMEGAEQVSYLEPSLLGIHVLATPLLGAGHGKLSAAQSLDEMMRGVCVARPISTLRAVKLVIPNETDVTVARFAAEKYQLPIEPVTTLL